MCSYQVFARITDYRDAPITSHYIFFGNLTSAFNIARVKCDKVVNVKSFTGHSDEYRARTQCVVSEPHL